MDVKFQSVPRKGGGVELLGMTAGNRDRVSLLEGLSQGPQVVRGVLEPRKAKVEVETFDI